jgi:iron-sulfur cluster repair protein YtfE (RIC family)
MTNQEINQKIQELIQYYTNGKQAEFEASTYSSITFKTNRYQEMVNESKELMEMAQKIAQALND